MRIRVKSNPTLHTSTFDIPSLYLPVVCFQPSLFLLIIQFNRLSPRALKRDFPIDYYYLPRECADSYENPHAYGTCGAKCRTPADDWITVRDIFAAAQWEEEGRQLACIWIPLRAFHRYGWSVSLVTANDSFPAIPTSENCLEGSLVEGRGGNNIETKSRINLRCLVARHSDYLG